MRTHPALEAAATRGVRLGLDHVRALLSAHGDPHRDRPTIHVAGTNGKGSTCTMITAALVQAGLRVGTFLSPHLVHVNERIRLDGVPVDDDLLDTVLWRWARSGSEDPEAGPPTYFELTMLAAFDCFRHWNVDVQVIEVGIGGRLDATNVVTPTVCAITSLGYDHVEVLGPHLIDIAREKAGIFKPGALAVLGPVPEEAAAVVRQIANAGSVPLDEVGLTITRTIDADGVRIRTSDGVVGPVLLPMAGPHQADNAAVAVGVLHRFRSRFAHRGWLDRLADPVIADGLRTAVLPGRTSRLRPWLLVDGAHNADGVRALARALDASPRPGRRVLVFGCGTTRDPLALLAPLWPQIDEVRCVQADHPQARPAAEVAAALAGGPVPVCAEASASAAIAAARGEGADEVVVAGSLYLLGDVVEAWPADGS